MWNNIDKFNALLKQTEASTLATNGSSVTTSAVHYFGPPSNTAIFYKRYDLASYQAKKEPSSNNSLDKQLKVANETNIKPLMSWE